VRTIKTLGIATAMALALIAVAGAAMASASSVFGSPGAGATVSTGWSGSSTGQNHVLSLQGEKLSCYSSLSGEMKGPDSTEITLSPTIGPCVRQGVSVGWAMNGCKFRLRPGFGEVMKTTGWLDIVGCESAMSTTLNGCQISIGNQNGVGSISYQSIKPELYEQVRVTASISHLEYTRSGTCATSTGTFNDGMYTGEWIVSGTRSGSPVNINVRGDSPRLFAAEESPVTILGENVVGNTKVFSFGANGYLWCNAATYSGTSSLLKTASFSVLPAYSSCTWYQNTGEFAVPKEVSMGACSLTLYPTGELYIVGASCASTPITVTRSGCTVTMGPQGAGGATTDTNAGWGRNRSVSVVGSAYVTLKYTATGLSCAAAGTFSDGSFKASASFRATNAKGESQGFWRE
jgi:hypothetical protein